MTSASRSLLVLAAALVLAAPASGELAVPPLAARVTDQTGTLDSGQRSALEQKLAAFEAKKGSQVAVLIVPGTQPEAIEQYSIRVVDQWKLGRKGVDDGVLLLVAKDDRKLRIEVGRGLEGAIPDAIAKRIIAEYITPQFKAGNYYAGIDAGVDRILGAVEGEALPAPQEQWTGNGARDWFDVFVFGLVALAVLHGMLRAVFGRFGSAAIVGGVAGVLVWLLVSVALFAALGGLVAFVLALFAGSGKGRHWSSGGGWGSGSGSWSSGGGGGGFSGGGGGFSGGGSSGSW